METARIYREFATSFPKHPVDSPAEAALQVLGAIGDAPSPRRQLPDAVLGRLQQVVSLVVVHFKVPLVGAQPQRHLLQPHGGGVEAAARSFVPRFVLSLFFLFYLTSAPRSLALTLAATARDA